MKRVLLTAVMAIAAVFLAKGQEPGNFQFKEIPAEAPIPTFRHPWQGKRVVILGDSSWGYR